MSDVEQANERSKEETLRWQRDSVWNYRNFIVAIIGIVIAAIIALWSYYLNRPVKSLTCDVIAVGPLVSVEDNMNNRVQVVFDHVPVPNVKFAIVKIANPGNIPINKLDFDRPLSLHFGGQANSNILTAQTLSSHPNNIGATYKIVGNTLTLDPLLLNPNDDVTLKIIYTGQGENMGLDARIVGVSEVTGTDPKREQKHIFIDSLEFAAVITLLSSLLGIYSAARKRTDWDRLANDPVYLSKILPEIYAELKDEKELARFQQFIRDMNKTENTKDSPDTN